MSTRELLSNRAVLAAAAVAVGAAVGASFNELAGLVAGIAALGCLLLAAQSMPLVLLNDPKVKYACKLIDREELSPDTRRFRFELPSSEHALGLPIGKHVYLSATINGKMKINPYTPITSDEDKGYFDLVIKVYFKKPPRFPDGGKMSQHLNAMAIGDTIDVRGPTGHVQFLGKGVFGLEAKKGPNKGQITETRTAAKLGLIAGGTGITPCLQVIRAILADQNDTTTIQLLYANQTEADILTRPELEAAAEDDRFSFHYTLDRPPEGWAYSTGFISEQMVRDHLPAAGDDVQILMCGPPIMVEKACLPNLEKAGFTDKNFIVY